MYLGFYHVFKKLIEFCYHPHCSNNLKKKFSHLINLIFLPSSYRRTNFVPLFNTEIWNWISSVGNFALDSTFVNTMNRVPFVLKSYNKLKRGTPIRVLFTTSPHVIFAIWNNTHKKTKIQYGKAYRYNIV